MAPISSVQRLRLRSGGDVGYNNCGFSVSQRTSLYGALSCRRSERHRGRCLQLSGEIGSGCMDPMWYRTFFDGITVDFWREATTPQWTQRDVELTWRESKLEAGNRVLDCLSGRSYLA